MLPSAAELTYFLEVSNSLNFSRASERLGISQPSLSLAMQRLEKSVGTKLFIRHKQGVSLTQAGKHLLLHARQLLQYWEKTKSAALASELEVQGQFTIGCNASIAIYMVSTILPNLLEQHPKLSIKLKHDISRKITEEVINLSIDLGIVVNPIKHPDLVIRKLFDDEFTFWKSDGKRKTHDKNSTQSVLLCNPELTQTQALLKKSKKIGFINERIITSDSLEVIANLTVNGCGIGILPTRIVNAMYPHQLKRIPKAPVYSDEVCLVYRNEVRDIQAIKIMIQTIKEYGLQIDQSLFGK